MSDPVRVAPVPYTPSVEVRPDDEEATIDELIATMTKVQETTFRDGGHALRSVHAKSFGLLNAKLTIDADLPVALAQGLFAHAATYPIVMRFSAIPGDLLPDSISTPRGLSIKVLGVSGERLPDASGTTQDFVMVNGPAFGAPTPKKFLGMLKGLAATTDKVEGLKQVLSSTLQVVERAVEALGGESATLKQMGGHPETNVLGETYYTQTPLRYGDYIAKVSIAPSSPGLTALTDAKVDLHDKPNGLRGAVVDHFATQGGTWELRVQLCTDLEKMPIEDAAVEWKEDGSPYVTVGRIVAEPQEAWTHGRSVAVDDGMSFSPWHGLAAHRPLGGVMRARKRSYEVSSRFRAEHNGHAVVEPEADTVLS